MDYLKTHLFTGWWTGRMSRKPFIISVIAITVAIFLFFTVFVLGMVGVETGVAKGLGLSVVDAQNMLRSALSVPAFVVMVAFQIAVLVITCAIAAKRVRDIGLPGWPLVFVFIFLDTVLLNASGISFVFMCLLAITPTATFNVQWSHIFGKRSH